jgi:phage/conjugal plasmid C-4 type zinc finger TraR family protein
MSSDVSDLATEREEIMRDEALARQRAASELQLYPAADAIQFSECRDCCEYIPIERRTAVPGCTRCQPCQQANESRMRGQR